MIWWIVVIAWFVVMAVAMVMDFRARKRRLAALAEIIAGCQLTLEDVQELLDNLRQEMAA